MFKELIKLANALDAKGFLKEADTLDNIIRKMAEDEYSRGAIHDRAHPFYTNSPYRIVHDDRINDRAQPFQSELKRIKPEVFNGIQLTDSIRLSAQGSSAHHSESIYQDDERRSDGSSWGGYESIDYPAEDYITMEVMIFIKDVGSAVLTAEAEKALGVHRYSSSNIYSKADVEVIQKMIDLIKRDPSVVIPFERRLKMTDE